MLSERRNMLFPKGPLWGGKAKDGLGRAKDGFGKAKNGLGKAKDGFGKAKDGLGKRKDALGKAKDSLGKAKHAFPTPKVHGTPFQRNPLDWRIPLGKVQRTPLEDAFGTGRHKTRLRINLTK